MSYKPIFPPPALSDTLTVYYIEGCPYCNQTRQTLSSFTYEGRPLKYILYNVNEICNNKQEFWGHIDKYLNNKHYTLKSNTKHHSFPVIFLKGQLIGGNSDFQKIINTI